MDEELNEYLECTCGRCDDGICRCCQCEQEYLQATEYEETNYDEYINKINDLDEYE